MNFLEKTAVFDLAKHFDRNHPDVRIQVRELFERTKITISKERKINLEVVLLIGCLEVQNAAVNLRIYQKEKLAEKLGLTPNQYWKRAQAGRALIRFPEFIDLVLEGQTHISHIAIISPKLDKVTKGLFYDEIPGKSEREIRELAASIDEDGSRKDIEPTMDVRLSLTKSEVEMLDRAKEVLSSRGKVPNDREAIVKALGDLLEKRDPIRKAERAEGRRNARAQKCGPSAPKGSAQTLTTPISDAKEPPSSLKKTATNSCERGNSPSAPKGRQHIPASRIHKVNLRDRGRCTKIICGERCNKKVTVQIDHILPIALGGTNDPGNLRTLCRDCNVGEAYELLGAKTMDRHLFPDRPVFN